jgi:hypothetical protein
LETSTQGIFEINWDVALDSKKRKMGLGFIMRDSNGKVSAIASYSMDSLVEPVVAETLVALGVVKFFWNQGLEKIILESDSLQVVNALNKPGLNWNMHGQIVADIIEVLRFCQYRKICHIKLGVGWGWEFCNTYACQIGCPA